MLNKSSRDGLISLLVVLFLTVAFKKSDWKPDFDPSLIMLQNGDLSDLAQYTISISKIEI